MPPFQRKTLVLVGAKGVGRRTLKQRLINADKTRFGAVTPRKYKPHVCSGISFLSSNFTDEVGKQK